VKPGANPRRKILLLDHLVPIIAKLKNDGQRVVLANGCFDLLHVGHIRYLCGARAEGDVVVVAVNSDQSVRRLKGKARPVQPEAERAELVAALECVDYVIIFNELTVEKVLHSLQPHLHCKGTDYTAQSVPEREVVHALGGEVKIVGDFTTHATRDLINRIRNLGDEEFEGAP